MDPKAKYNFQEGETLLFNKPYKWTSFDVVKKVKFNIKRKLKTKIKVGHAGTLDPLATGLLIICTGKNTKKISTYQDAEKEYTGTFYLGASTPSFDLEKAVDQEYPTAHLTEDNIKATTKKFLGEIEQVPPIFSALKIDGDRAYNKARKGEAVEMKARKISIRHFEIEEINLPEVRFKVICSKGTYIRSLARDFGKALGSGAYLSSLCRTRIGEFTLDDAISPKAFEEMMSPETIDL